MKKCSDILWKKLLIWVFCFFWQMITVNASLFPSSITNSLIAVGNDGLQERDRMVRACIAIICELGENLKRINKCYQFILFLNEPFSSRILLKS